MEEAKNLRRMRGFALPCGKRRILPLPRIFRKSLGQLLARLTGGRMVAFAGDTENSLGVGRRLPEVRNLRKSRLLLAVHVPQLQRDGRHLYGTGTRLPRCRA